MVRTVRGWRDDGAADAGRRRGTRARPPPPDPLPQGEGEDLGHRARRPPFPGQPDRRGGDHRGRRLCAWKGWRPDGLGLAPGGSQRRSGTDDPSGQRTRTDHDHRIRHRRADRQQRPAGTASRVHRAGGCVARAERIAACGGSATAGTCSAARSIQEPNWRPAVAAADMLARLYPAAGDPVPRRGAPRPIAPAAMPVAPMLPPMPRAASRRRPPVDVVVPVHGGAEHTLPASIACWRACGVRAG